MIIAEYDKMNCKLDTNLDDIKDKKKVQYNLIIYKQMLSIHLNLYD